MVAAAVVTMVVMAGLIGCGVVSSLDCGSPHRLPHAYSQTKDHMAMASVRMHGRRRRPASTERYSGPSSSTFESGWGRALCDVASGRSRCECEPIG